MHENAQKFNEKLRTKFPAVTRGYFMAKFACLDDVFSEVFQWEASPV